MPVGALKSTLGTEHFCIGEIRLPLASSNSELDGAVNILSSTERRLLFAENAVVEMLEQVRGIELSSLKLMLRVQLQS